MSESNNCFKEAVCAEVQRVFDSCSDRDCIYELPITLTEDSPSITNDMDIVRTRCAEVEVTCISVDSVPFKSGYYSVDITYRFKITAEAFSHGYCKSQSGTVLCGTALWNKRVILYGSEGSAKIFTSDQDFSSVSEDPPCEQGCTCCDDSAAMPKATVRVIDPIALDTKFICVPCSDYKDVCPNVTPTCSPCLPGPEPPKFRRAIAVSLGLFSIVQLSRPVSIIVPAYDYCIPCKDCSSTDTSESPCDVFDRIDFPSEQFFPRSESDSSRFGCAASVLDQDSSSEHKLGCSCEG